MGKENNARECDVSKDTSRDLEAHDGGTCMGGVGTEGTCGHMSEENGKMGVES